VQVRVVVVDNHHPPVMLVILPPHPRVPLQEHQASE